MRIVFIGTPDFAVASLDALLSHGYDVVGIVTATDKYGGRGGNQILQSDIKKYALSKGLKVLQPEKLRSKEFIKELKDLNADIQIVVAFRMLPEIVWDMPPLGTYNIHGSLLPKYRGAAPINWAIINGEIETGVTLFQLKHEIDSGNILLQKKCSIEEEDDFGSLYSKMKTLGAAALIDGLEIINSGRITFIEQEEKLVSHAPKIFHETGLLNFNEDVVSLHNLVRGLSPYPTAYFIYQNQEMKVFKSRAEKVDHQYEPGSFLIDKKTFKIAVKDGYLHLLDVQLQGKKRMAIGDFLNGLR